MGLQVGLGFASQCVCCTSHLRPEIDRRILDGESSRTVAAWLATEGVKVSHVSVAKHHSRHLDIADEVTKVVVDRVAKAKARAAKEREVHVSVSSNSSMPTPEQEALLVKSAGHFRAAVIRSADSIETIERNIDRCEQIAEVLTDKLLGEGEIPSANAGILSTVLKEIRASAVARQELLEGKRVKVDGLGASLADFFATDFAAGDGEADSVEE